MTLPLSLDLLQSLERSLVQAMRDLEQLKVQAMTGSTAADAPEPAEPGAFVSAVRQALFDTYGNEADFEPATYERLWQISNGDAETVATFIRQLRGRSKQPDSVGAYTVSTFRKIGVAMLRAEQLTKGLRTPQPISPTNPGPPPAPEQPAGSWSFQPTASPLTQQLSNTISWPSRPEPGA